MKKIRTPSPTEALDIIAEHGSEDLKHLVDLAMAGPPVHPSEEAALANFRPRIKNCALAVRLAIAETICAS